MSNDNVVGFPTLKSDRDLMADDLQKVVDRYRAGEITSYAVAFVEQDENGGYGAGSAYDATMNVSLIVAAIAHMQHEILTGQTE